LTVYHVLQPCFKAIFLFNIIIWEVPILKDEASCRKEVIEVCLGGLSFVPSPFLLLSLSLSLLPGSHEMDKAALLP
jgi:hypothetical protein